MDLNKKICYITAFLDIGRSQWKDFQRDNKVYFDSFKVYVDLFKKTWDSGDKNHELVAYIDERYVDRVKNLIPPDLLSIKLISINNDFLISRIYCWKFLEREREILNSEEYKHTYPDRIKFPENSNPLYTMITHSKIDFVCDALSTYTDAKYACWVDFGYFQVENRIPNKLLNIEKLNLNTVNWPLIQPLDENDKDLRYTMLHAPEKFGAFFFFGRDDKLKEFQQLYHGVLHEFHELNLVDDEQHLALRCYYKNEGLFTLHVHYGWHRALVYFQLD
jgi:hypothetical protein